MMGNVRGLAGGARHPPTDRAHPLTPEDSLRGRSFAAARMLLCPPKSENVQPGDLLSKLEGGGSRKCPGVQGG